MAVGSGLNEGKDEEATGTTTFIFYEIQMTSASKVETNDTL
jgi:hypothetical protein